MTDPMAAFREKFRQRCAVDRERLALAFEAWRRGDASAHGELVAIAHGLAGAGGTFGFSALGDHASEAEARLLEMRGDDPVADRLIADLLAELRKIERREVDPD